MDQIVQEAEQVRLNELEAERRQKMWAKVRRVTMLVVGAAIVGYAYAHRLELGQRLQQLTSKPAPQSDSSKLGENLKNIQGASGKRDSVLDELTQK